MNKIKEKFIEDEQQLFVSYFFCYLKYDKNKDFVIDLDDIWKWLGFKQKNNAKIFLEKNFSLVKKNFALVSNLNIFFYNINNFSLSDKRKS